jgi:2-polyprenyl-3-methyl-5-hydroxy-6-metoxy-1,4-benzoquinol methylase
MAVGAAVSSESVIEADKPKDRQPQLAYSEIQGKMHDEDQRRIKARKIIKVLHHFLGRDDLDGLHALDIGCSTGFIAHELAADGAVATGVDIDVPGIEAARVRFGETVSFLCTSADALPLPDESLDIVVFNHIYEHVVDPDAIVREIHRVLKPSGVVYLGLGNKYQLIEAHYGLPLLSWLPKAAADRYIRRFGKADEYYEQHRSYVGLKRMLTGFQIWDYTVPIVRRPDLFGSGDQVRGAVTKLPAPVLRAVLPIVPTYVWIGTKGTASPRTWEGSGTIRHLNLSGVGPSQS